MSKAHYCNTCDRKLPKAQHYHSLLSRKFPNVRLSIAVIDKSDDSDPGADMCVSCLFSFLSDFVEKGSPPTYDL